MELRKFYEKNGVDYDAFLQRLMGKESLAVKYIKIFLADSTFDELAAAVEVKDVEQVGEKVHTLKGIALNLSLTNLSNLCMGMLLIVRAGRVQDIDGAFALIKTEYEILVFELQK